MKKVNGGRVTLLKFHAVVDDICVFMIKRAVLHCTHYGELNYVNTNWYEVVLARTCQDICSARTTQLDIWVLYCIVWRFCLDTKPSVQAVSTPAL